MKVLKADSNSIQKASEILKSGGLVAFPTETVYGLGANALDSNAVEKIFIVKKRPATNPLIVHTYSIDKLFSYAQLQNDKILNRLSKLSDFWPGPLTVILPRSPHISPLVSSASGTIALRIPAGSIALELLKVCGLPLAAPSANQSGYISPTRAEHVEKSLGSKVDLILDGGDCKIGIESTVLNLCSESLAILRPGSITKAELEDALSETINLDSTLTAELSPGRLKEHYSPHTPLIFTDEVKTTNIQGKRVGMISFKEEPDLLPAKEVVLIKLNSEPNQIAKGLYAALHELDQKGLDFIFVDKLTEEGLGLAIMDRLKRAVK